MFCYWEKVQEPLQLSFMEVPMPSEPLVNAYIFLPPPRFLCIPGGYSRFYGRPTEGLLRHVASLGMCSHDFFPVQHDHERLVVEFRGSSMKSGASNLNFSFEKFKSQTQTVQFQAVF